MNYSQTEGPSQVTQLCRQHLLGEPSTHIPSKKLEINKLHPQGEFPVKESVTDCGWDVTLINRTESRPEDELNEVNEFGTGLKITPPQGYYLEVVGMNSLHKHGYMLPGPVVIDFSSETNELVIPLLKFRDADDLVLPFRAVRLIAKPVVYMHLSHKTNPHPYPMSYQSPQQPQLNYPPGVPRPHAPQKGSNHMF